MIGWKHHSISSKMAAVVVCCLCNGCRSWWNGLKYCFLQCIRLHRITGCSFFHPQRLGGNFISCYRFVDCFFSPCTRASFLFPGIIALIHWCTHFSFSIIYHCYLLFPWPSFLFSLHRPLLLSSIWSNYFSLFVPHRSFCLHCPLAFGR